MKSAEFSLRILKNLRSESVRFAHNITPFAQQIALRAMLLAQGRPWPFALGVGIIWLGSLREPSKGWPTPHW